MLHLSSHYIIGATHTECQDFTLHGDSPMPHLIVCDGCSSSTGSHMGARVLAKTAQYLLQQTADLDYYDFGEFVIHKGQHTVSQMGLPNEVLDSTLLVGFVQDEIVTVYIYGDGCVLYQKQDNTIGTINIEFADNAPYYLTYWLAEAHQIAYAMRGDDLMYIDDSVNLQVNPQSFRKPLIYQFPLAEYKTVALTSDGAVSCVDVENGAKKPLSEIAPQLLNVTQSESIEQRIQAMKQAYSNQQVYILDDLAVAILTQVD